LFCLNRRVWLAMQIFVWTSERYTYGKQRICFSNSGSAHFHVSWLSDFIFYQKPLYKSLHQSFFYSFITILVICNSLLLLKSLPINIINCIKFYVNCSALTGVYDWQYKYLFVILWFRHLSSIFQTFVTWLRENHDYRNVSCEMICI
jgi:hypothetical protein